MADQRPVIADLGFENIKQDIINHFKERPEFSDYEFTGSGLNLLMDVLAYNTHYNSLAANFLVNEMFLDSALLRNNVSSIAKALNYIPRSSTAARATLRLTVNKPSDSTFFQIPAGQIFTTGVGNQSYNFYTLQDYTVQFLAGETVKTQDVIVAEGNVVTQRFVYEQIGQDTPFFEFVNANADTSTLTVTVNGVKYEQVRSENEGIVELTRDSLIYHIEEGRSGKHRFFFGDGVIGREPQVGDVIVATYLSTNGDLVNGASRFSYAGGLNFTTQATAVSMAQGGAAPESIREIKANAPHWYQAQYRAVTENDYEVLLRKNYPDIQSVNVYGGETVGQPGKVFFSIKPKSADTLSDAAKQSIVSDILSKYNVVTVTPEIVDPQIIKIVLKSVIQYDNANLISTPATLKARVVNLFNVLNTDYIGSFLASYMNSRMAAEISSIDSAIVSSNTRLSLRFDTTVSNRSLGTSEWSFNNRLFHPYDGYNAAEGGVLSTNLFQRFGSSVMSGFDDDGYGNVRLYDVVDRQKVTVNAQAGTINYETGAISIATFDPMDGNIQFTVVPDSFDVVAQNNTILQIAVEDSLVQVVDQNAALTISNINTSRSA